MDMLDKFYWNNLNVSRERNNRPVDTTNYTTTRDFNRANNETYKAHNGQYSYHYRPRMYERG